MLSLILPAAGLRAEPGAAKSKPGDEKPSALGQLLGNGAVYGAKPVEVKAAEPVPVKGFQVDENLARRLGGAEEPFPEDSEIRAAVSQLKTQYRVNQPIVVGKLNQVFQRYEDAVKAAQAKVRPEEANLASYFKDFADQIEARKREYLAAAQVKDGPYKVLYDDQSGLIQALERIVALRAEYGRYIKDASGQARARELLAAEEAQKLAAAGQEAGSSLAAYLDIRRGIVRESPTIPDFFNGRGTREVVSFKAKFERYILVAGDCGGTVQTEYEMSKAVTDVEFLRFLLEGSDEHKGPISFRCPEERRPAAKYDGRAHALVNSHHAWTEHVYSHCPGVLESLMFISVPQGGCGPSEVGGVAYGTADAMAFLREARVQRGPAGLIHAVEDNDEKTAKWALEERHLDPNYHPGGPAPLSSSARNNNPGLAKLLLDHDADVNFADDKGNTAAHDAAASHADEAMKVLARPKYKADLNRLNKAGDTPLLVAVKEAVKLVPPPPAPAQPYADYAGPPEPGPVTKVVRFAVTIPAYAAAAPIYALDWLVTPKHASPRGSMDALRNCVIALLKSGADPKIADASGQTPLEIAKANHLDDLARELERRGARQ